MEGNSNTRSWSSIVSGEVSAWNEKLGGGAVSRKKLKYVPPTIVQGKPFVHVSAEKFPDMTKKYENLIIGGFVGRRMPYLYVKEFLEHHW